MGKGTYNGKKNIVWQAKDIIHGKVYSCLTYHMNFLEGNDLGSNVVQVML